MKRVLVFLAIMGITYETSITADVINPFVQSKNGIFSEGTQNSKYLQFASSPTDDLIANETLASPEECFRTCTSDGEPKICLFHFTLEYYNVLGAACQTCIQSVSHAPSSTCQCVTADGLERSMLTANRMLPGPSIQVCERDKVVIDVENRMEGMEVTLHWHGILQRGTQYYDGVPFVTQCPVLQGNTYRYMWHGNAGTHFWHAHTGLQKMDGLYGSIVVRQPPSEDPSSPLYDYDLPTHVVLLSDWLHELAGEKFPGRLVSGRGQAPDAILINGKGQTRNPNTGLMTTTPLETFTVTPGKRYRFRLINAFSSTCPAQIMIEGHELTVIATDGDPVQPVVVNSIVTYSGERWDFVIQAKTTTRAFWIQVKGLGECGITQIQQLAILRYEGGILPRPPTLTPTYVFGLPQGVVMNPVNPVNCDIQSPTSVCVNQLKNVYDVDPDILQETPDLKIFVPFRFFFYTPPVLFQPNTYNKFLVVPGGLHAVSLVDGISYTSPASPMVSQYDDIDPDQFCNGDDIPGHCAANPNTACSCTHKVDLPLNAVVEVILIDEVGIPLLSHPFHLHGFSFNVIGMGISPLNVTKIDLKHVVDLDRRGLLNRRLKQSDKPPYKDTIAVPSNGYVVFRFRADNPGFWLFHCHFLFHLLIGMDLVFQVGTPSDLPPVPPNFPTCGNFLPPIQYDD